MPKITIVFSTILAVLTTTACVPALVGGAAAGGYYVGQDDRNVTVIAQDASITAEVKAKYLKDDLVKALDINVDTYNGVVTLYGHVPNRATADRAVRLARGTKDVKRVVSRLTIR